MIEKISINNVTSYKSLVEISNLEKVNFFFGNNGSGKTTISRLLHNVGAGIRQDCYSACKVIKNTNDNSEILVFNSDFVERNFNQSDDLKGIFTLDETNADIDNQIENCKKVLSQVSDKLKMTETNINEFKIKFDRLKKRYINEFWDYRIKTIKKYSKLKLEHSGNKTLHFNKICEMFTIDDYLDIDIVDLDSKYKKYFDQNLELVSLITVNKFTDIERKLSDILSGIIVGKQDVDIAPFIESFGNSDWVERGKKVYIDKMNAVKCPFCQEPLKAEFRYSLEQYFDKTYTFKKESLMNLLRQYKSLISEYKLILDIIIKKYDEGKIVSQYKLKVEKVFNNNIIAINNKLLAMNEKKRIELYDFSLIDPINNGIEIHNEEVRNIDSHKNVVRKDIWKYLIFNSKSMIKSYYSEKSSINKSLAEYRNYKKELMLTDSEKNSLIKELMGKTVNTITAVDNINLLLKSAGFSNFSIDQRKEEKNKIIKYYLKRVGQKNDKIFKSLSEGEKQFISFLYFYQLCLGVVDKENKAKKKIIVFDDPISSMDSQVLFLVSTLIRKLMKRKGKKKQSNVFFNNNIEQIFLFTHNVFFYKEVSWKSYIVSNPSHYMISKFTENTSVEYKKSECFIRTDYELLWEEINKAEIENISLMNTLRRIIESYVKFMKIGNDSWNVCDSINEDDNKLIIYRALISTLNLGSHSADINNEIYFHSMSETNSEDIKSVFHSLFTELPGGKEHYNKMMELNG